MFDRAKAQAEWEENCRRIAESSYIPVVVDAHHTDGFDVWVQFDDGKEGEINLKHLGKKPNRFADLADPDYFKTVFYDKDMRTIAWPNGLDIAPESLYEELRACSKG